MSDLPEHIKRKIWERDGYRCQECGIKVGQDRGLKPQTHHTIPKSLGGNDEEENLVTLCLPCHATKLGHTFMLAKTPVVDFPLYIKWCLWDISTNLLAYADYLDPRKFSSPHQVIEYLKGAREALETVISLAEICQQDGIGKGTLTFEENPIEETLQVEDIIDGLRITWKSHYRQKALDQIIGKHMERLGMRCPLCRQGRLEYRAEERWQGFRCRECSWKSPTLGHDVP